MIDQEVIQFISSVGFPIAAFLLVYMDLRKKLEDLAKAVNALAQKI